jgi:hypothetical protein
MFEDLDKQDEFLLRGNFFPITINYFIKYKNPYIMLDTPPEERENIVKLVN